MLVKWVSLTLWQNQVCAQDFLSGPLKASLRAQARLEPDSYNIHFRRCGSSGVNFSLYFGLRECELDRFAFCPEDFFAR